MEITFHLSEKYEILTIDAWENFDNTCKKSFSYLKKKKSEIKKIAKGVYTPTNPSPIYTALEIDPKNFWSLFQKIDYSINQYMK